MGPSNKKTVKPTNLHASVRRLDALFDAWSIVREKGLKSDSVETRDEVNEFARNATQRLRKIQNQLSRGTFAFKPAKGVLIKKKNKGSKRPVVIAPIETRIVQRALLDVLQAIPGINAILHEGYNFGGVSGKEYGVPAAISKAVSASQSHSYFVRTDIKSFFAAVPRDESLKRLLTHSQDPKFNDLLRDAAKTELRDLGQYHDQDLRLFPLWEHGVAQGSCLSPLLCNFLLADFDRAMNARGIICIRYIDDFIIFAKSKSKAMSALRSALLMLQNLGLSAYDPFSGKPEDADKAEHGSTAAGFTFLGCDVKPDRVRPSEANRAKLLHKVSEIFNESISALRDPEAAVKGDSNYADAVRLAGETIRGWGNTYAFCSDDQLMRNVDTEIDKRFATYNNNFKERMRKLKPMDKRRALGLFSLTDCNKDDDPKSARSIATALRKAAKRVS